MPRIFISYRRSDSAGHAGRLYDRLRARYGPDRVFMDVTGIEAGMDFVEAIDAAVGSCDVLLAVIGREWLSCRDGRDQRRLDDGNDFIRLEIASALKRNVRVIPVLVEGALMPDAGDLPENLKNLTRRQAVELRDSRWDADAEDLIVALEKILAATPAGDAGRGARVPPLAGPPATGGGAPGLRAQLGRPGLLGGLAALAALVLGAYFLTRDVPAPPPEASPSRPLPGMAEPDRKAPGIEPGRAGVARQEAGADHARPPVRPPQASAPAPEAARSASGNRLAVARPKVALPPAAKAEPAAAPAAPPVAAALPSPPRAAALDLAAAPPTKPAAELPRLVVYVWSQPSARRFWDGANAEGYSANMAKLYMETLRGFTRGSYQVQRGQDDAASRRVLKKGALERDGKALCAASRAAVVFTAYAEDAFAISPADSAFWPELRMGVLNCRSDRFTADKQGLAPENGEAFPFAADMEATMNRFVGAHRHLLNN